MVNPTYPGVYVQEVSSGVRPIQAVGTSTAAFVGVAEMGPVDDAHRISSWTEYQRLYGSFTQNGYLAEGVFQFFNNGGRDCYVVRVAPEDAVAASAMVKNRAGAAGVEFTATSPGEWGNCLVLTIEDSTPAESDLFTISVRRQEDPGVIPKDFLDSPPLEIHDQLGMDPAAPNFVETVLARNSQLITAKVHDANTGLEPGVHVGGKGAQLPLGDKRSFQISLDGDGLQTVTLEGPVSTLDEIATAIETAVKALHKKKASTSDKAFSDFSCKVEGSEADAHLVLKSGTTASPQSSVVVEAAATNNATRLLKIGEPDGVSRFAFATRRPEAAKLIQLGDAVDEAAIADVTPGTDGTGKLTVPAFEKGFGQLDNKTDFSLLAVPGESSPQMFSAGVNYCENKRPLRDVFFIGETADHDVDADAALEFAGSAQKSSYGAVYFPWIKASDPSGKSSEPVLLPPSGYIAGLYARTDADRGVWKAPAGTAATLGGAVGLATELSDTDHGRLNPKGVNAIRRFANAGIVSFGARTLSGADPEWNYVSVRRLGIMLRSSVYYGIQWAVFEPNEELLWSQLRLNLGNFMMTLFRQGAFQGSSPTDAFFVKCDSETTTQADIDLGVVNVVIGFAPLKPAEFVIVRISQKAGQA